MSNQININGHEIRKTQIGAKEYKVSVFQNAKLQFQFTVSLQPTGKDNVLPTYKLTNKSQTIPEWAKKELNIISEWIIKNEE